MSLVTHFSSNGWTVPLKRIKNRQQPLFTCLFLFKKNIIMFVYFYCISAATAHATKQQLSSLLQPYPPPPRILNLNKKQRTQFTYKLAGKYN
jgi:hypothetical protein